MTVSGQTFLINGAVAGALLQHRTADGFAALTCFRDPGGALVHVSHRLTRTGADPFAWSDWEHTDLTTGTVTRVSRDETTVPARSIPSYATALVLEVFAGGDDASIDYVQLADDDPALRLPATLRRDGRAPLPLPGGSGDLVTLLVNGALTNRFWFDGGVLLACDWQGAVSVPEPDLDRLATAMPDDTVRSIVRTFAG